MAFSISFDPLETDQLEVGVRGSIVLGEFQEYFDCALRYWDMDRYRTHWRMELQRLVAGEQTACLITSLYTPGAANYLEWWPIYMEGTIAVFQNQHPRFSQLDEPFDEHNPSRSVEPRESIDSDGQRISEWPVPLDAIRRFLNETDWS